MATIDYMIASYGAYAASATGGNALARDFLAGVAAMYSVPCKPSFSIEGTLLLIIPVYEVFESKYKLEWPTMILAGLAFLITMPIYVFYWKGAEIRRRSKFAQDLAEKHDNMLAARAGIIPLGGLS